MKIAEGSRERKKCLIKQRHGHADVRRQYLNSSIRTTAYFMKSVTSKP
jgi:hypothetical protein